MVIRQYSQDGSSVQVEMISRQLLFIDPVYFDEVAAAQQEISNIPGSEGKVWLQQVERLVFPYGGQSLLGYMELTDGKLLYELDIGTIKAYDSDEIGGEAIERQAAEKSITAFGIDAGSFLIIDMANLDALLPLLRADDLFDLIDNPDSGYIEKIYAALGNQGWAFVVSPGVGKGVDFQADGSYYIL